MLRSFSFSLLITWFAFLLSCKPVYVSTQVNSKNISIVYDSLLVDSQLVQKYLPYKEILEKDMERVISFSETELVKGKPESGLTNLLSDLLLVEGKKFTVQKNLKFLPEVSYFNYGGIRTSLPKGEITVGKIFELMPFENEMVFIQLNGTQIQQFLNKVADDGGDGVAGVKFIISNGKAKNVRISGEELMPDKMYWIVTNDYSANGGDNLKVFTERKELIGSGSKIRDIIISNFEERLKNEMELSEYLDGRITNE